jgi:hypothetical protein
MLGMDGKVRHTVQLATLFTAEDSTRFRRTGGGCLSWLRGGWIDEAQREVVVVGLNNEDVGNDPVAIVDMITGRVRRGGCEEVRRAIVSMNRAALTCALDVAIRLKLKGVGEQLPIIVGNRELPVEARLRAAVLLASFGDKSGAEFLVDSAVRASRELLRHPDPQDVENERFSAIFEYAVEHLPDVLGEKALPTLREVSRQQHYPSVTYEPFCRLGHKSVPQLIQMLTDESDPEGQFFAIEVLGRIKADGEAPITALKNALKSRARSRSGRSLKATAASALGEIGPPAITTLPALLGLLSEEDETVRKAAAEAIRKIRR